MDVEQSSFGQSSDCHSIYPDRLRTTMGNVGIAGPLPDTRAEHFLNTCLDSTTPTYFKNLLN
jgi:hypothetical protein